MATQSRTAKEIFVALVGSVPPQNWDEHVARLCAGNEALSRRVRALLQAHAAPDDLLDPPSPAHAPTVSMTPVHEAPGAVIGPYKLLEQIGEGGFGVVFMAEQERPVRRKVALKVIKPGMDTRQVVARFEAERQALALMDHPNIARVLDAGATPSGRPYFVMELVRGVPISRFCDGNRLPPRERLELFASVCQAVQHAHAKGIIHRDLKPSNVLVALHDGRPVAKVIDFGVAKATERRLTEKTLFTGFAEMLGTPLYMSPEQAQMGGLDVDTRSDVYSLGVVLYELLTGTTPFDQERLRAAGCDEIRRIIREEEPAPPSTRVGALGKAETTVCASRRADPRRLSQVFRGEVDWIVMKALEKDRNRRYETAAAFAADVRRYLADEPVLAGPPSRRYRLGKFARRHRAGLAITAAFALAVLVALGSLLVSHSRISAESAAKTSALSAAEASEQDAVDSLRDALGAVDQMLTQVSEEKLRHVPQMEPVRRVLLQDALEFYQKFLERKSDHPAIRRETALAYQRVGNLHYEFGDYAASEAAYRRGFAMLDELDAESPLGPDLRSQLVRHCIEFSWTLGNQGKRDEAEEVLRRAVALAEELAEEIPESAPHRDWLADATNRLAGAIAGRKPTEAEELLRRNLALVRDSASLWHRAMTHLTLGRFLAGRRRPAEAEAPFREAVSLFEQAVAQSPSPRGTQIDLSGALQEFALALDANGRTEEAEATCRRAIPIFDRLAADFPAGPHHRWCQARMHFQHAGILRKLKRAEDAEATYRRAVELSERLAEEFPTLPGYAWTAFDRRRAFTEFLLETGRTEEARQAAAAPAWLIELMTPEEQSRVFKLRGNYHAMLGEWDQATSDFAESIARGSVDVAGVWYPLAVLHLHAGRADEYRALCNTLLERPGASGGHWVVITCKLGPDAVADLSRPVEIAAALAAGEPQNPEYVGLLGDVLYRQGDLEGAVPRLEASVGSETGPVRVQWRKLTLAMAYHRLGRAAEARQLLGDVAQWMDRNAGETLGEGADLARPLPWVHRLDLHLLRREAEGLLMLQPMPAT